MTSFHDVHTTLSPVQSEPSNVGTNLMPRNPDVEVCPPRAARRALPAARCPLLTVFAVAGGRHADAPIPAHVREAQGDGLRQGVYQHAVRDP